MYNTVLNIMYPIHSTLSYNLMVLESFLFNTKILSQHHIQLMISDRI